MTSTPYDTLFPFFWSLSDVGRRDIRALPVSKVAARRVVLRRGDSAGGAYLVVRGTLRVYYVAGNGQEATLYRVEPGGTCVLALSSTLNSEPYPAWVESAREGCAFARVPNEIFHRLLETEKAFQSFVLSAFSGRIFELMRALEEAGSLQVEQRVARYLLRHRRRDGASEIRVTQAGIAADLGTAREVVFRALRSLASRKLIATGRGCVRVLDEQGLSSASKAHGGPSA